MEKRRPARLKRKEMASKATQAILLQDVEKLGRKGDVVHVAAGYLRNYLGPRKLAEAATDARVAEVGRQAEQRRRHEAQGEEQARDMAHTLNRTVLTIKR
jgi:large subunit ribosomal protein L9